MKIEVFVLSYAASCVLSYPKIVIFYQLANVALPIYRAGFGGIKVGRE